MFYHSVLITRSCTIIILWTIKHPGTNPPWFSIIISGNIIFFLTPPSCLLFYVKKLLELLMSTTPYSNIQSLMSTISAFLVVELILSSMHHTIKLTPYQPGLLSFKFPQTIPQIHPPTPFIMSINKGKKKKKACNSTHTLYKAVQELTCTFYNIHCKTSWFPSYNNTSMCIIA